MANTETTINAVMHPQPNETPIDIEKTIKALERNKFVVHYFETGAEAVAYLKNRIRNKCVAIGDSHTLLEIGVHDALSEVNEDITDIQRPLPSESFRDTALRTMGRDVFLLCKCTFTNGRDGEYRRHRQSCGSLLIWLPRGVLCIGY